MTSDRKGDLAAQLLTWPGVTAQPHRFGGMEFVYEGKEFGHLHGDYLVDLLLPKPMRDEAVAAGSAQPHHIYPDSGWVSVYLRSEADRVNAVKLLRAKYERLVQSVSERQARDNR